MLAFFAVGEARHASSVRAVLRSKIATTRPRPSRRGDVPKGEHLKSRRTSTMHWFAPTAAAIGVALFSSGCGSSSTGPTISPICSFPAKPFLQQLYPVPGANGVSPNVGVMIIAGTGSAPIRLNLGSLPYSGGRPKIRTRPEPLPNPLPNPEATPGPIVTMKFAVSFGLLKAHTTYEVYGLLQPNPCFVPEPSPGGWSNIGSFSTQ